MFFLKSKFRSLFIPAYSNPKHQEGTVGSVLTKWRADLYLGTPWYSYSPFMTTSVSKHCAGAQQIKTESTPHTHTLHSHPPQKLCQDPAAGEQLVVTLLAFRQRYSGGVSFRISNACSIYLLSLVRV